MTLGDELRSLESIEEINYSMSYPLLTEDWLPVIYNNGIFRKVSLACALQDANEICQLAAANPMDHFALTRLLLAIVYSIEGNSDDQTGLDLHRVAKELERSQVKFNLFGDGMRFMQNNLATQTSTSLVLLHEVPSGENFSLFNHVSDSEDGLCPACCALGLIRLPVFAWGGLGPGKLSLTGGLNGTPPIYCTLQGSTLHETLSLNWKRLDNIGAPIWAETPSGVLRGLTEPPRHIWLGNPETREVNQRCVSCGSAGQLVFTCTYNPHRVSFEGWIDPNVFYEARAGKLQTADPDKRILSGKFCGADRMVYSLFQKFLAQPGEVEATTKLHLVGFALDQAKFVDVWERIISPPACTEAERIGLREILSLLPPLPKTQKVFGDARNHAELFSLVRQFRADAEEGLAEEITAKPMEAKSLVLAHYRSGLERAAESLAPGYSLADFERRMRIERCTIDPTPSTKQRKVLSKNRKINKRKTEH
jgi:hypothetical protein